MNKITVKNLNVLFNEKKVLNNINLECHAQKITAIIGPSGCGKSTLIRTLNRMTELSKDALIEGKVYLNNTNIYKKNIDVPNIRKQIGMVFQKPNPFPKSIYDNIAYGLKINGIKNKTQINNIVEQSLQDVGLWDEVHDRLNKSALTLSGGQQQRLCIARTLAINPKIILLDEPTSALDPIATYKIEELILKLKEKYTIIIVTHNMQQAARISDYTLFLYMGKVIEYGETKKIFTNPDNKLTEDYIAGKFG